MLLVSDDNPPHRERIGKGEKRTSVLGGYAQRLPSMYPPS